MSTKEIFKKQGGKTLIKQYIKSGVFFTAVNQFLTLGKSRTALEILRLSVTLKIKNKLAKKYKKDLKDFEKSFTENIPTQNNMQNKIWFCWLQGIDKAPAIVKDCFESLRVNLKREIILIDEKNIYDLVDIPDFITEKYKSGMISKAHFSDIIRLELLTKYGGTWIDATVFCTKKEKDIPSFYFNSNLFMFQNLKPGRDGHADYVSNWFITSTPHNKLLEATKYLLYKYWSQNKTAINYYIFHIFMSIVIDYYEDEWKQVVPIDNSLSHILLLNLNYLNDEIVENTIDIIPFHKLSYKKPEVDNIIKRIKRK